MDYFRFRRQEGPAVTFEVFARRYGSSLDSFLEVLDSKGKVLANNDDAEGKDSRIDWSCPADGDYLLAVRDLNGRGGDTYVYYLAAAPARPDFTLECDDDKALLGPGGGYAMYVIARRRNGFAGDIKLSVEDLPSGVTATADRIPANMTQACVTLTARPTRRSASGGSACSAPRRSKLPDGKTETLRREVVPQEEIYTPGGGRGRFPVQTHVVSVTEPSDVLLSFARTGWS